jgi:hypothetical protein
MGRSVLISNDSLCTILYSDTPMMQNKAIARDETDKQIPVSPCPDCLATYSLKIYRSIRHVRAAEVVCRLSRDLKH